MEIQNKDVVLYQIVDCLVEKYNFNVIRFNGQKQDLWLTNPEHTTYPIIRINADISHSTYFEMEYLNSVRNYLDTVIKKEVDILVINTNKESSEFEENGFLQVLLTETSENIMLFSLFPELKKTVQLVENNEQEVRRIFRNLETYRFKKFREQNKANKVSSFVNGCIGFLIVMYLITLYLSSTISISDSNASQVVSLVMLGGYYKTFIVAANEYWRFLTAGFLHMNAMHLVINLIAFYSLAQVVEKSYKRWQFIIILLGSIIMGSVFNFIFDDNIVAVGVSGGLYGLLATYIVLTIDNQSIKIPQVRSSIFRVLLINIMISLIPGISFSAHLGGFIGGLILGFMLLSNKRLKEYTVHVIASSVLLLIGIGYFIVQNQTIDTPNKVLDAVVVKEIRGIGFTQYADHLEDRLLHFYQVNGWK